MAAVHLSTDHALGMLNGDSPRLILVAPPQALGDLRAALPADVSDLVSGELHKDLTHATIHDITEHLGDVLAV